MIHWKGFESGRDLLIDPQMGALDPQMQKLFSAQEPDHAFPSGFSDPKGDMKGGSQAGMVTQAQHLHFCGACDARQILLRQSLKAA
ncbi:hypothetical protein [Fuscovulum ytuae]|uniref:Uncharacterized protein n=1 Tax=Fuscovulum ytuae TaxID=3042299 RepID=A0ABY8Q7E9_9RHOB|nr:hypothetical protein [Fuscovulum sp. YMD61]WGV16594.1 hypothetical protein QF092_01915 [Fuscovulum sp. YMD61]